MKKLIAGLIKWKPKADPKSERASPSKTVVPPHEIAVRQARAREEERANTAAVEPARGDQGLKASASKGRPGRAKERGERKREQIRETVPVQTQPEVEEPALRKPPSARDEAKEAPTNREAPSRKHKRHANDPVRMPQEKVGRRRVPAAGLSAGHARGGGAKSEKVRRRLRHVTFGGNVLQDAERPTDKRRKKVNTIKRRKKAAGEPQLGRARKGARRKTRLGHL